jgi:hypothetical protein
MNLHRMVSGIIGTVNPHVPVKLQISSGFTTAPSGKQVPVYEPGITVMAQVQQLTTREIQHLDSLNIQNNGSGIYLNGFVNGVVRVTRKGGDLITMSDGTVYLVTSVLEQWPDWCKVAVTLQNGA